MKQLFIILVAALPLAAGPTQAAQAQTPPLTGQKEAAPTFREAVEVRVMDLDVVVTDSRGRPVPDLTRQDFTVTVDGKAVPIDYFTRVEEGTIHAPDLDTASPERVLAEYRKAAEAYVPRDFLIYFDSGHISPAARNRALEALRDLVTRLGPSDSARVVLFDRSPKELTEWTASKERLFTALDKLQSSGVGMSRLLTEQQTLRNIDSTFSRQTRAFEARNYAEQERAEVKRMLDDMNAELSTLTALPGKKIFLFLSGGFDMQPGSAMMQYAVGSFSLSAFDIRSMASEIEALVKRANASDITFATVDARGLAAEGASASDDDPLASRLGVSFFAREDSQAGLKTLAQETGGLALVNSNDFEKGLSRVYQDSSTYYSIGVNLSKIPGTGYHRVKVTVSRPGLTARTRQGFAARSTLDRGRDVAQAALKTNVQYRAIPVDLRVAAPSKLKKYYGLPILITIPASALTFLPQGDSSRAVAEVYLGAIDDKGNMSDITREEATFNLAKNAPPDAPLKYTVTLQVRKGNVRVVVNVRDKETGKMGTAKADVRVE